jgi:hypothetical protein
MHILFLCPFSKAVWFSHPSHLRTEYLATLHNNLADMIQALLSIGRIESNFLIGRI